ncbi:hypothetical protein ACTFBT_05690 [Streptomyces microflavus]|uniref:hypothetical protein n=1 Tax=Streptomyces TaxID=1883 RepID=UPI00131A4F17|nr:MULTISPECIES: hypothetical protein [Streptomyces]MDX2403957.1 hypothetical protein [Streptomyces microflavus]MDX2981866.1 hypothetical protein [Streptomyces sp. NRRL_B-2249]GGX97163.1 hypothetical protein GCM10010298_73220 [Streptomyces microflavus]
MSPAQLADRDAATVPRQSPRPGRAELRRAGSRRARRARRGDSLSARYLGYVGYFVGAGLISGAVVHYPLDPARYTRIAGLGVLVFLAATVLNEFVLTRQRPAVPRVLLVIGASLLLSFGIGMLSGGMQHFDDFPDRAAVLIPLGIAVSFVAYYLKEAERPARRIFSLFGLVVLVTTLAAFFGLRQLAAGIGEEPESGGHSHGSEEPASGGQQVGDAPAESDPQPSSPATAPDSSEGGGEEEGGGHAH